MDSVAPIKNIRVNASSKLWLDSEIISAIQKRDKLYSRYKKSGSETDKDISKASKKFLQKMLHRKKSSYFQEN